MLVAYFLLHICTWYPKGASNPACLKLTSPSSLSALPRPLLLFYALIDECFYFLPAISSCYLRMIFPSSSIPQSTLNFSRFPLSAAPCVCLPLCTPTTPAWFRLMLPFALTITIASLCFCFLYSKLHIFAAIIFRSHPSSAQKLQQCCCGGIQNTSLLCTKALSYSPLTSKLNTDSLVQHSKPSPNDSIFPWQPHLPLLPNLDLKRQTKQLIFLISISMPLFLLFSLSKMRFWEHIYPNEIHPMLQTHFNHRLVHRVFPWSLTRICALLLEPPWVFVCIESGVFMADTTTCCTISSLLFFHSETEILSGAQDCLK